jgi:hypothetical protein
LSEELQRADEDWGESTGAHLAEVREANSHKRFELHFQLKVLGLLSLVAVLLVATDVFWQRNAAKDLIVVILPAFTFVLGKIDKRDG